jgi:hypothetical protein
LETLKDLEMLFAAVTYLVEGLSLETLLTLKVEKFVICLAGTRRPTVYAVEQRFIFIGNVNKK